jgi:uncharacterized protein
MSEPPTLHSRRALTLRFDIPIAKTSEFWESLKKGKFVTTKCAKCGTVSFPPQADCPKCLGGEFTWVQLDEEATLLTFTHVQMTPASFAGEKPYTIAIGEFSGGVRVLAWLERAARENVKPGMKLRIEARMAGENPYYVFVPV